MKTGYRLASTVSASEQHKRSGLLSMLLIPTLFAGVGGALSAGGGIQEKTLGAVEEVGKNIFNPGRLLSNVISFGPGWTIPSKMVGGGIPGIAAGMYAGTKLTPAMDSVFNIAPSEEK